MSISRRILHDASLVYSFLWSRRRRRFTLFLLASFSFIIYCAVSFIKPRFPHGDIIFLLSNYKQTLANYTREIILHRTCDNLSVFHFILIYLQNFSGLFYTFTFRNGGSISDSLRFEHICRALHDRYSFGRTPANINPPRSYEFEAAYPRQEPTYLAQSCLSIAIDRAKLQPNSRPLFVLFALNSRAFSGSAHRRAVCRIRLFYLL